MIQAAKLHGIPILISEYVPRGFIASLRELPGESILQTALFDFPFPTQEKPTMPRLIPTRRGDVKPGQIFRNAPTAKTRFRAIHHPTGAPSYTMYSQALNEDGYPEARVSWNNNAERTVYVETDERRSGTDQRQSDRPHTEPVKGYELSPGDSIYSFGGVRTVVEDALGYLYRSNQYNRLVQVSDDGAYARVLPDRRSGRERRSGD